MRICVFCGSRMGVDPDYAAAAAAVGRMLAEARIGVVYGGGRVGLMGVVADAAADAGGETIGVIPKALSDREVAHQSLSELIEVDTMHERKAAMAERSDAFLALPGGAGTLDEIFEQWTWAQLGVHAKPSAFLNVKGYYDPLRAMIARMVEQGYVAQQDAALVAFHDTPEAALAGLKEAIARPPVPRPFTWTTPVRP